MNSTTATCAECQAELRPGMLRCRECGAQAASFSQESGRSRVLKSSTPAAATGASEDRSAIPGESDPPLLVVCVCGTKFRVKSELAGRRIKCPKCSQGLTVPVSADQPTATASGRIARPELPESRSFVDMAADLVLEPPIIADPPQLKERLSKRNLQKLITACEKKSGDGKAEAELRRNAILKLGESTDSRATKLLSEYATDYWISVREGVCLALGTLRDPAGVPALVQLLGDEVPEVRRGAIVSLGKIGDARAVRPLLDIALKEPLFRFTAGESITKIGRLAVPILVQILRESDPGRALEAIIVLGKIKDASAVEPLASMLSHNFEIVRSHACESLGYIADPKAAPALIRALGDAMATVRSQAVAALQRVPDQRAVPSLLKLLSDEDLDVRVRAAMALGEIGDRRAADPLLPLLQAAEPELRGAAVDALGRLGDERAAEAMTRCFHDEDEKVRLKAVSAFRWFRSDSATLPLLHLLEDGSVAIRQRAADALGEIGNPIAVDRLAVVLRTDRSIDVRMAAAKSLGQLKSVKGLKALEDALDDDLTVRCRAISALGDIGDPSSLPALLAMLKDPTPEVRYHAAQSLGEIGHQNSRKPLEDLLGDGEPMVRRGAAKALIKLGDPRGEKLLEQASLFQQRRSTRSKLLSFSPDWLAGLSLPSSLGMQLVMLGIPALLLLGVVGWFGTLTLLGMFKSQSVIVLRGDVSSLAFSPDGDDLAVGRTLGLLEIWNASTGEKRESHEIPRTGGKVAGLAYAPDGKSLLLWTGSQAFRFASGSFQELTPLPAEIRSFAWEPGGTNAISYATDGTAYVWDLSTGEVKTSFQLAIDNATAFAATVDASRFAIGAKDSVHLIDATSGTIHGQISGGELQAVDVTFTADGEHVIVLWNDGSLAAIDYNKSAVATKGTLDGKLKGSQLLTLGGESPTIGVVSGSSLEIVSTPDLKPVRSLAAFGDLGVQAIARSADGAFLAGGSEEESLVLVTDFATGKSKFVLDER